MFLSTEHWFLDALFPSWLVFVGRLCRMSFFTPGKPILFIAQKIYTLTMECETKPFVNPLIASFVEIMVIPWLTLHVHKTCFQSTLSIIPWPFPRYCWHALKFSVKSSSALFSARLQRNITPTAAWCLRHKMFSCIQSLGWVSVPLEIAQSSV